MNWFFWKHKQTGAVVTNLDYQKVPLSHRQHFDAVSDEQATHTVDDASTATTLLLTTLILESSQNSVADQPQTDFSGFGGGSGGGAGATSSFDNPPSTPDTSSYTPDTSSYSSSDSSSFSSSDSSSFSSPDSSSGGF